MKNRIEAGTDEIVFDGKFIRVVRRPFENVTTGGTGDWYVVERKTFGSIVGVLPITPEGDVVLVDHYRVPHRSRIIELCAGLCDKPGETEVELARRELLEETGYEASSFELLMRGATSPGLTNDTMAIYIAWDAVFVTEPKLEDAEDIRVFKVPMAGIREWMQEQMLEREFDIKLIGALSMACTKLRI